MAGETYTRRFNYSHPVRIGGQVYPTSETGVVMDGVERKGSIFAGEDGRYYTLDEGGNIVPTLPVHQLDEVVVTPNRENLLTKQFNDYLTQSNDNTLIGNVPHRQYNTHLTENALSGAKAHAAWDKEHPNLSAWRDAATAVPFAVAAAPVVGGFSEAALGTAAGQTARNGLSTLMSNPIVDAANTTLGLGFAGKGAYDVSQGEFTPETAMDLVGGATLLGKGLLSTKANTLNDVHTITDSDLSNLSISYPLMNKKRIPSDIKQEAARKYTDFINSNEYQDRLQRAGLENHWQYMKDLTDRRVNGKGNFPGKVREVIGDDPLIEGRSGIMPLSPYYGITLQGEIFQLRR